MGILGIEVIRGDLQLYYLFTGILNRSRWRERVAGQPVGLVWTAIPGLVHPGYAQVSIVMCSDPKAGWSSQGASGTRSGVRAVQVLL